MSEVTKADVEVLHAEVRELRELVDGVMYAVRRGLFDTKNGSQTYAEFAERMVWVAKHEREEPIFGHCGEGTTYARLVEADVLTLEEAARRGRREVAALSGVGRITLAHLDTAMAERGLDWEATS